MRVGPLLEFAFQLGRRREPHVELARRTLPAPCLRADDLGAPGYGMGLKPLPIAIEGIAVFAREAVLCQVPAGSASKAQKTKENKKENKKKRKGTEEE